MATQGWPESGVGPLLRRWRSVRRLSQLELSLQAGVSARHLSFLETGRAQPSREMVLLLAGVLGVPLREQNALLQAAGYAALYRETPLDDPQMAGIRQALELILQRHEPFGAVVFDRYWNLRLANEGFARLWNGLAQAPRLPAYELIGRPWPNVLRALFDPAGLRSHIANWPELAQHMVERLQREALATDDEETRRLLRELLAFPGVPARWQEADVAQVPRLVVPVELLVGPHRLRLFSTLTTLGAPQDITLHELRIEAFHPADPETEQALRALTGTAAAPPPSST
jgi:transcriptional regulator with XRE-family HTH domain